MLDARVDELSFCTSVHAMDAYMLRNKMCRHVTSYESVRVVAPSKDKSTITTMECSFALTGKDYVIIAADTTAARSIVKMKVDEDKIKTLSPHLLMAYSGESGSSTRPYTTSTYFDLDYYFSTPSARALLINRSVAHTQVTPSSSPNS